MDYSRDILIIVAIDCYWIDLLKREHLNLLWDNSSLYLLTCFYIIITVDIAKNKYFFKYSFKHKCRTWQR